MDSIIKRFGKLLQMLEMAFRQKAEDKDLSTVELEQFKGELEAVIEIVDYELKLREEAYNEAAAEDAAEFINKLNI